MPFTSRAKSATSLKKIMMDVALRVELNSRSLTVAAEYPAGFASFEGAVVVELVGEDPLGLADKH
eukprot:5214108-Pleurochrysis_carterae.AAC.1